MGKVEEAIAFAVEKHAGQTRKDGSPYIYHPITVADILRTAGFGEEYQLAGILHDTLEDTDTTEEELCERFGEAVTHAVKLLTRPEGMPEDKYVAEILTDKITSVVKSVDKIHNVWSAVTRDPVGSERDPEHRAYAKKYVDKAMKYYAGKFNPALTRTIARADELLSYDIVPEWELPYKDSREFKLYSEEQTTK